MRMVLHGVADDIGHFVKTAVVFFFEGVEDAPLNRFQPIVNVRLGFVSIGQQTR